MKRFAFILAFYCATAAALFAQNMQQQQQQPPTAMSVLQSPNAQSSQMSGLTGTTTSMFTSSAELYRNLQNQGVTIQPPPYDAPVDTNSYVLGPGDLVNVGIWGPTPLSFTLSVTPDGTLVIPTFGVLRVGGMTIAKARAYARKRLGEQFKRADITLTLVYPRTFYVVVAGEVKTPGRYMVTAFDRVDRAFTLANLPKFAGDNSPLPPFSLRRIKLIHPDGTVQNIDLLKFYQAGDVSDDPYLQQGDAIVVPKEDFRLGSISITGAVKMQGTYEYVTGDRLKDLLEISQGLTRLADSTKVKVFEPTANGYTEKIVDAVDTSALDMPLPSDTRVVVPVDRKKVDNYYVWVSGEVSDPGIYPISSDTTRLTDVIKLAGGFTKWASLPAAVIYRTRQPNTLTVPHPTSPSEYVNRASNVNQEALGYASQELNMRFDKEVVSTDFVKLFADHEMKYDVTLRAGDSIYVPQNVQAVYVFGQVRRPGYVNYQPSWTYTDYIAEAGGLTDGAEHTDIMILKHGTYQWYKPDKTEIQPGDLVFVPRVSIKPADYGWNRFKDILGTVGAIFSLASGVLTALVLIKTYH